MEASRMKELRPEDRRHVAASDRPPDEAALREVITRYGPMILATCRRILGDAQVAEDAAQVTLLAFYRKAPGRTGGGQGADHGKPTGGAGRGGHRLEPGRGLEKALVEIA
jgi:hypothetical protein